MRRISAFIVVVLYVVLNLFIFEAECRGGKGGTRGFRHTRYSRKGSRTTKGLAGVSLTVWEIVGTSFAVVTVVGIVGFLFLYNCCDKLPDEENCPEKTQPLVSDQEDQVHTTDETHDHYIR